MPQMIPFTLIYIASVGLALASPFKLLALFHGIVERLPPANEVLAIQEAGTKAATVAFNADSPGDVSDTNRDSKAPRALRYASALRADVPEFKPRVDRVSKPLAYPPPVVAASALNVKAKVFRPANTLDRAPRVLKSAEGDQTLPGLRPDAPVFEFNTGSKKLEALSLALLAKAGIARRRNILRLEKAEDSADSPAGTTANTTANTTADTPVVVFNATKKPDAFSLAMLAKVGVARCRNILRLEKPEDDVDKLTASISADSLPSDKALFVFNATKKPDAFSLALLAKVGFARHRNILRLEKPEDYVENYTFRAC